MGRNWTAEEYREYLRTGREPAERPKASYATCCARSTRKGVEVPEEIPEAARANGTVVPMNSAIRMAEKRRNKYGNKVTYADGKRFDSEHEAKIYLDLKWRVKAGELRCVLRQVRFDLAETEQLQYVADFVTIAPDMTIKVLDAKSEATRKNRVYIIKKKLMREKWGIEIEEV